MPQNQVLQFTATAKPTFCFHRKADQLSAVSWGCAKAADRGEHVLLCQGPTHIGAGEVDLLQSVRIQPYAKGELAAAEHLNISNSGDGEEGVAHGLSQPAAQKCGFVLIRRVAEAHDHQQIVG